jgi:catechol 2,3-dioxygenase-like lactoylglutathione lyase family enzyme
MKRLHVHVAVDDLPRSVGFYSALFAAQPAVLKPDYAKWLLDDPRVNFAISTRGREPGLDHLGIQAENGDELKEIYARLRTAGGEIIEQGQTTCCYAKSEKILDRRPRRHFLGNVLHHRRQHRLRRRQRRAHAAHRAREVLLRATNRAREYLRLHGGVSGRGRPTLQRALSLYRQFGSLDHCRSDLE